MFGDGKGLDKEVKFSVAASYDAFNKKWGDLVSEKLSWVETWSDGLSGYSVQTIRQATDHCLNELSRSPTLPEFRIYCDRINSDQNLHDPIVSKVEKIARAILETPKQHFGCSNYSELSDALLIAASIASAKAHEEVGLEWSQKMMEMEFERRAGMFGSASVFWKKDAQNGKGYWADILRSDDN